MFGFKLSYCKAKMAAYINGELSLEDRRRIGRYIDESPACYAVYMRHRELKRELCANLPTLGQPASSQLDRMWANIQRQMVERQPIRRVPSMRFGLATLSVLVVLCLPMLFGGTSTTQAQTNPLLPNMTQVAVVADFHLTRHETASATPAVTVIEWVEITDVATVEITPAAAITPSQDN